MRITLDALGTHLSIIYGHNLTVSRFALKGRILLMSKVVTTTLLWTIIACLLITLVVPKSLAALFAALLAASILVIVIVALRVYQLICVFVKIRSGGSWRLGNSKQAEGRLHRDASDDDGWTDDLVDGTAMDLIDWTDKED